jgi:hypothetical protein
MGPARRIQFLHDVLRVKVDSPLADMQDDRDLPGVLSLLHPAEDFLLPARQDRDVSYLIIVRDPAECLMEMRDGDIQDRLGARTMLQERAGNGKQASFVTGKIFNAMRIPFFEAEILGKRKKFLGRRRYPVRIGPVLQPEILEVRLHHGVDLLIFIRNIQLHPFGRIIHVHDIEGLDPSIVFFFTDEARGSLECDEFLQLLDELAKLILTPAAQALVNKLKRS